MTIERLTEEMEKQLSLEYTVRSLKDLSKKDIGEKVSVFGWVRNVHEVGSKTFFWLYAQFSTIKCIYAGTKENRLHLTKNTSIRVFGPVKPNPTGDQFEFEVQVEKYRVIGEIAPGFEVEKDSTKECFFLDNAHILVREPDRLCFLKTRAKLLRILREFYHERGFLEITPPTLVQTQVEGGSTLFDLDYFGEKAYLTQSSQLYLETVVPACMKAYCIASSYRAEKSNTRRHLSEYTHVEAEIADIDFDALLSHIEDLFIYATEQFVEQCREDILAAYPDFVFPAVPSKPFRRVTHAEAIRFLQDSHVLKEDGTQFTLEDDIPDAPERLVCDEFGKGAPVFLTNFPAILKSFYMEKCKDDKSLTNSCDLLYPGIGEVLGGSMRIHDHAELMEGFRREGIDPSPYKFYTDQCLYGPSPHGGYGIGFERFFMALMSDKIVKKVRQACLYPRFRGRCRP